MPWSLCNHTSTQSCGRCGDVEEGGGSVHEGREAIRDPVNVTSVSLKKEGATRVPPERSRNSHTLVGGNRVKHPNKVANKQLLYHTQPHQHQHFLREPGGWGGGGARILYQ